MKKVLMFALLGAIAASNAACQFYARSPEDYRDATQQVLATRGDAMKSCYDGVLKTTPGVSGNVTVHFMVEHDTGKVGTPTVVKDKTTAPDAVQQCVITNLNGLVINPPDKRDGDATFSWDFQAPPAAASAG